MKPIKVGTSPSNAYAYVLLGSLTLRIYFRFRAIFIAGAVDPGLARTLTGIRPDLNQMKHLQQKKSVTIAAVGVGE